MKTDKATNLRTLRDDAAPMQLLLVDDEPRILSSLVALLSDTG